MCYTMGYAYFTVGKTITDLRTADTPSTDIPSILSRNAAIMAQIEQEQGPLAETIMSQASSYQKKASDPRFAFPRTLTQNIKKATKAQQIVAERANARRAALSKSDVRMDGYLFCIRAARKKNAKIKMEEVEYLSCQFFVLT